MGPGFLSFQCFVLAQAPPHLNKTKECVKVITTFVVQAYSSALKPVTSDAETTCRGLIPLCLDWMQFCVCVCVRVCVGVHVNIL